MVTPMLQFLRNRWFVTGVHAALWLVLYLAVVSFGAKAPALRDTVALSSPASSPAPVSKLEHLFSPGAWPRLDVATNVTPLFFTRYFTPTPPPPPPAPTTRKVDITYLGYLQTEGGPAQVMVKLADAFVVRSVGGYISTNWLVGSATLQILTLTNTAAQTNLLPLSAKKEIEVPVP
jgi:hypothetical protein